MATWCKALFSSSFDPIFSPLFPSTSRSLLSSPSNSSVSLVDCSGFSACSNSPALNSTYSSIYPLPSYKRHLLALPISFPFKKQICRAAEYKFPDPIPEFADFVSSFPLMLCWVPFFSSFPVWICCSLN